MSDDIDPSFALIPQETVGILPGDAEVENGKNDEEMNIESQ